MSLRVAVLGAAGRMGSEASRAVEGAEDLELVAGLGSGDSLDELVSSRAQIAIDLTRPDVVMANLRFCVEHGIHVVVGTSGFDDQRISTVRDWLDARPDVGVLIAPNFALGAVLMMRFAAEAGKVLPDAAIVELHHETKLDAPSGTAKATAALLPDGTPIHSVRLPGLVAHQEVIFGGRGQTLTIRHDTTSREAFVPGVLLALEKLPSLPPGLTVGLDAIL
jgi:4-hydroxy-tetrahydrodipicolinate reductase